jgi:hypothetical protein
VCHEERQSVGNKIDVNRLIGVLNEIVVTEIVCYLRYSDARGWMDLLGI